MKFRKKPVEIEAVQYAAYGKLVKGMCNSMSCYHAGNDKPHVHTMHDGQIVNLEVGDWIIPEPDGKHFYPCKPDIFAATYEATESEAQPKPSGCGSYCHGHQEKAPGAPSAEDTKEIRVYLDVPDGIDFRTAKNAIITAIFNASVNYQVPVQVMPKPVSAIRRETAQECAENAIQTLACLFTRGVKEARPDYMKCAVDAGKVVPAEIRRHFNLAQEGE